jgi:hypothetical protein
MKWNRLANCPLDVRRYRHLVDLAHQRLYVRPMITEGGLTRTATYLMDPSGNQYEPKDLYKILIFRTEMVYFHVEAPQPWGLCLLAAPAAVAAEINMVAGAAYRVLAPVPHSLRPIQPSDRQIHWLGPLPPSTILTSWITLNPGWTFHLWSVPASALAEAPPAIIQYHDAANTRAAVAAWLEERSSLRAEETVLALWDSDTPADHDRVLAYLRGGMLLAAVGGGVAVGAEATCLRPLDAVLDIHAGSYMGSAEWFTYAAGDNEEWQDLITYYVETVLTALVPVAPTVLPPAPFVAATERQVCLFSPVGPLMPPEPEPEPTPSTGRADGRSDLAPPPPAPAIPSKARRALKGRRHH